MAEWIKEAENLPKIARESNLFAKKVTAKEIFGSNLVLANREARLTAPSGEDLSGGNAWAALCAANEKVGEFAESQIFQNWLEVAQNIDKIASDSDLFAKKVCAKEIFGSHLLLGKKQVRASAPDLDSFLANSPRDSGRNSGGNHWDALRASRMLASKKPLSSLLVLPPGFEPGFSA